MFQTSLGRPSLAGKLCLGVIVGAFLAPAPPIWGQPFTGHPIYPINFSTDASSTPTPYSMPGFEAPFSVPGGDILGAWLGQGLQPAGLACARPGIICAAGPAGMGMGFVNPAHCVDIDAYSTGEDMEGPATPWTIIFSVDRNSRGFQMPRPLPAAQWSDVFLEAGVNDAAADEFVSGAFIWTFVDGQSRLRLMIGLPGWNYLGFDGDGVQRAPLPSMGGVQSCLGLVEPSPPGAGDNLDGCDNLMHTFDFLTTGLVSPFYTPAQFPPNGMPVLGNGSSLTHGLFLSVDPASAAAFGCSPADILCTNNGGPPWVWAPAAALGLNPATDDIDALAILMTSDPALSPVPPGGLYRGYEAFILFSVTPSSGIVGTNDVLWNIPIMPSDILMEATSLGFPGRVAILIPAGGLGILPFLQRPPGVFTDNLDALQIYSTPSFDSSLADWVEWESFVLGGDPEGWLPEGTIQEWDDKTLPPSATLPEGPLDPNVLVNNLKEFRRGDANQDGELDISDAAFTLGFLFLGAREPACRKAADTNDSGEVDLSDPVYGLMFLFTGGGAPPAPFPGCGKDETPDSLGCESYAKC